jgi:fibronectin type 3 domain-containing protein
MKTNMKKSLFALIAAIILAIPAISAFAAGEPVNVTGLTATAVDSTSIGLSWNSSKDASGGLVNHYRVYYGTTSVQTAGSGEYGSEVDTPNNSTSYVVTGLTAGTTYYFAVTAIDSASLESEAYSVEANATTAAAVAAPAADTASPTVASVENVDKSHVKVVFSEAVTLPDLLPEAAFSITEQINPTNTLEVMGAVIDTKDTTGATVILETAVQTKDMNYIVTAGVAVTDAAGNPIISGSTDSGLFAGSDAEPVVATTETPAEEIVDPTTTEGAAAEGETTAEAPADTTAPEDITALMLTFKEDMEKFIIVMDWTASLNTAKDLVDQILYQSMDRGTTYGAGTSLGTDATHYELPNMEGGKEYTFKITTKDAAGNESVGVVKSIRLPQTGAGIGLLLLGSAGAAGRFLRRKK